MSDTEEKKVPAEGGDMDNIEVDDVNNLDENLFNQGNDLIDDAAEQSFSCTHPQNKGGNIFYKCKGSD